MLELEMRPCYEPADLDDVNIVAEKEFTQELPLDTDQSRVSDWYPGAWIINMGGNGNAITARPAEDILHIAASSWNIPESDPTNGNLGIAGWNKGAKACTGYNDQFGNFQQYCNIWSAVNGTKDGNWRCRTWEAWNPEGLTGSSAQYNSSEYTAEQCERWSDLLAWLNNIGANKLENMQNSLRNSHGCGVHRYGIPGYNPFDSIGGERWTVNSGKVCPGTARVRQLNGIINRALVIASVVKAGHCNYLPPGRVNLAVALARTGGSLNFWQKWGFAS